MPEEALALGVELKNDDYISRVENERAIVFRRLGRPADAGEATAARSAHREWLELIGTLRAQWQGDPEQQRLEGEGTLPESQTMVRFEARQGDRFEALRWAEAREVAGADRDSRERRPRRTAGS